MRTEHIQRRLEHQLELSTLIAHAYDNLIRVSSANVTRTRVNTRLSALKDTWNEFSVNHNAVNNSIADLDPADQVLIQDHSYFSENIFTLTYESYLESVEKITALLDSESRINPIASSTPISINESTLPAYFHHTRLPRINLPKFDGSPSEWLNFRDLFSSLVLNNPALSPVEKLQYLITSLTSSAAHFIKNTALTADNFQVTWDALISFYENKRILVNSALQSLLSIKRMTKESATEMENLYTTITQIYRTLDTLQRPVQHWDDFLVFITVQRLDSDTVKAWEHHLGSGKDPPSWKQLSEFLITRLLSLQAFEKSRTGKIETQTNKAHAKTHFQAKSKENISANSDCVICKQNHFVFKCPSYNQKTLEQKSFIVSKHKLCYNCLGSHRVSMCKSTKRCLKCGRRHHTSLHKANLSSAATNLKSKTEEESIPSTSKQDDAKVLHSSVKSISDSHNVLLATAQVIIITSHGESLKVRALIDPGSEISLISERIVQRLRLPRIKSYLSLTSVGTQNSNNTKGSTKIKIRSHFDTNFKLEVLTHILTKVASSLPSVDFENQKWSYLKGLTLADPRFFSSGPIDLLLGAKVYSQIIEEGLRKGPIDSPTAKLTKLGWIILGSINSRIVSGQAHSYHVSCNKELHDQLRKFWEYEEIPYSNSTSLSAEEQECETHFQNTHSRDSSGRYVLRLPFKQPHQKLGDSRSKAVRIINQLSNKFKANPAYAKAYADFMVEYERLNHMKRISDTSLKSQNIYYLPHHGVLREQSLTTKLRVVFNGSSPSTSGYSLNDLLHTDIEKMFRQVRIHPDDWNFQRILWVDSSHKLVEFALTTVTYGLVCAPFLALRTLNQLALDEGSRFPLALPIMKKGRYVDDFFGGSDSVEEAQRMVSDLNQLCMAGGFSLQKWCTNHSTILDHIPLEKQISFQSIKIEETSMIHTLGLQWDTSTDSFRFALEITTLKIITKRTILSTVAKLFDPLGLLSPITISAKILIQELWSIKLDWDDPLPKNVSNKWINFIEQLKETSNFTFPRWLGFKSNFQTEIHGFCDASQQAIAAVVYLRTISETGEITTNLIASKTKVAPLKRLTIPRLELTGAVLLTKLVSQILQVIEIDNLPIFLWTDSAVTHTWINNHPSRWKDFVHNRVCLIQDTLPQAVWKFISGKENPADLATRGITPTQLAEHTTWWTGPLWLAQNSSFWPNESLSVKPQDNLEEKQIPVVATILAKSNGIWDLIQRYSSLTKLLRITALCKRVIARFRKTPESFLSTPLTTSELNNARIFWVKTIQKFYFSQEIKLLSNGKSLSKSNSLIRLTPFLDTNELLRVGGRLNFSMLSDDTKHPLILPKDSALTMLVIQDAHLKTLHSGTQLTLSYIRNYYWIVGGRTPVRSFILKCVRCARYRQKRAQQIMGQLPPERVTPSRPFIHSGIDYAGPLVIKTWRGKNAKTYKAYIALFVCFSTSAIHLELVTDYSTEAFIAAYKRFTSRRGICATLTSDCGTNLKGADAQLQSLFSSAGKQLGELSALLAKDGTQ